MAVYVGYNTIGQFKNTTLTDFDLIKRDILNAFNIRQGEVPGRPTVGTGLWNLIFENQSPEITEEIYSEIQKTVDSDIESPTKSLTNDFKKEVDKVKKDFTDLEDSIRRDL